MKNTVLSLIFLVGSFASAQVQTPQLNPTFRKVARCSCQSSTDRDNADRRGSITAVGV